MHPIQEPLAGAHPELRVDSLVVDHREVHIQDRIRTRLDPLAEYIR